MVNVSVHYYDYITGFHSKLTRLMDDMEFEDTILLQQVSRETVAKPWSDTFSTGVKDEELLEHRYKENFLQKQSSSNTRSRLLINPLLLESTIQNPTSLKPVKSAVFRRIGSIIVAPEL